MDKRLLKLKPKAFLCPFCCTWHNISEKKAKTLGEGIHRFECDTIGITPYYRRREEYLKVFFEFDDNKCTCWSNDIVCKEHPDSYIRTEEIPWEDFTTINIRNNSTIGYVASFILPYREYVEVMRGFPASTEYIPYLTLPIYDKRACGTFCKERGILGQWLKCARSNFCAQNLLGNNRIIIGFVFDKQEHDEFLNKKDEGR